MRGGRGERGRTKKEGGETERKWRGVGESGRWGDRQTDRQTETERQTESERQRQRDRDTESCRSG